MGTVKVCLGAGSWPCLKRGAHERIHESGNEFLEGFNRWDCGSELCAYRRYSPCGRGHSACQIIKADRVVSKENRFPDRREAVRRPLQAGKVLLSGHERPGKSEGLCPIDQITAYHYSWLKSVFANAGAQEVDGLFLGKQACAYPPRFDSGVSPERERFSHKCARRERRIASTRNPSQHIFLLD
jgi:hypothetical protein